MPLFGKVGVEITRTAANSTALVAAVLLSRGVKEKGVMVKPSAPAHPERGKSGLAGGIKRRLSCAKKGAAVVPHQAPTLGRGIGGSVMSLGSGQGHTEPLPAGLSLLGAD